LNGDGRVDLVVGDERQGLFVYLKPYQPKAFFITAPEVMESVFSSTEVAREVSRAKQIKDAEDYYYFDRLPENDEP
jgi:hypothetical protein